MVVVGARTVVLKEWPMGTREPHTGVKDTLLFKDSLLSREPLRPEPSGERVALTGHSTSLSTKSLVVDWSYKFSDHGPTSDDSLLELLLLSFFTPHS